MRLLPLILLAPAAHAGGVLTGERLAVGIHPDGSLCDAGRSTCILYDPDGPDGPVPLGSDLLLPGRPFEAWSARWTRADGTAVGFRAAGPDQVGAGPALVWDDPDRREDLVFVEGARVAEGLEVAVAVDVPVGGDVIWTTVTLTAAEAVTGVELSRTVDVDPDFFIDGSYGTVVQADGEVAASGTRRTEGRALALAVRGGEAGICSGWCTTPAEVRAGSTGTATGDRCIGVAWGPVDLAAGETVRVRFAYGLGATLEQARERAVAAAAVDDLDGDGTTEAAGDCDDRDADTAPGAPERIDGLDNDCDGVIDEDTAVSDDDDDGFSEVDGDCDDADDRVHPGAEPLDDVDDADCDGLADRDAFRDGARPDGWGASTEDVGAGCATSATGPVAALLLLPLLLLRRRP